MWTICPSGMIQPTFWTTELSGVASSHALNDCNIVLVL
jgi:hypothetical protein